MTRPGGNVIVYSGTKKTSGNPVERAGFTRANATISVPPLPVEDGSADVPTEPMAFTLSTGTGTGWIGPEAPVRSSTPALGGHAQRSPGCDVSHIAHSLSSERFRNCDGFESRCVLVT